MKNIKLNKLSPNKNSKFNRKRICRGIGSGLGKTGGRGHKGQKSRSGCKINIKFQGGQTSIFKRIPKFGFNRINKIKTYIMKFSALNKIKEKEINIDILKEYKLISKNVNSVKIIFDKNIYKKIIIKGILLTNKVNESIKSCGGYVER